MREPSVVKRAESYGRLVRPGGGFLLSNHFSKPSGIARCAIGGSHGTTATTGTPTLPDPLAKLENYAIGSTGGGELRAGLQGRSENPVHKPRGDRASAPNIDKRHFISAPDDFSYCRTCRRFQRFRSLCVCKRVKITCPDNSYILPLIHFLTKVHHT
jgi:hypothetical protein